MVTLLTKKMKMNKSNENQNTSTETAHSEVSTSDLLEAVLWLRQASDALTRAFCWKNPEESAQEDVDRLTVEICGQRWTGVRGVIEKASETATRLESFISYNGKVKNDT